MSILFVVVVVVVVIEGDVEVKSTVESEILSNFKVRYK